MKRVLILICLFALFQNANAQQVMNAIKQRLDSHLSNTLSGDYLGGIEIQNAKTLDNEDVIYVAGTFKLMAHGNFNYKWEEVSNFRARITKVLDDVTVTCVVYVCNQSIKKTVKSYNTDYNDYLNPLKPLK